MLIPDASPAHIDPTFSLEAAILEGLRNEQDDATQDIGPIDSISEGPEDLPPPHSPPRAASPAPLPPTAPAGRRLPSLPLQPPLRDGSDVEYDVFGSDSSLSSAPPSRPSSPAANSKKRSRRKKSRAKRAKRRRDARAKDITTTQNPAARSTQTHIVHAEEKVVDYSAEDIPSASTSYVAKRDKPGGVYALSDLLAQGFELVKWDGRSAKPIVDSNGLVVAVLVGSPNDASWQGVHEDAFKLLRASAGRCDFTPKCMKHRRGNFAALNTGISFGGGPKMPGNLQHNAVRATELRKLVEEPSFIRLAGFASSAFATWMPRLHKHYSTCLDALTRHHPHLRRNFSNSVWGAAAFNFGPRTVTAKHRDAANLPFGICSVTALGDYDYVKGGHAVLWEFGLVVEFPPGSTILIPSAAVAHSNTPVGTDEQRCSFTQYSAGGLFRWVDHGFQKKDKYLAKLSPDERAKVPELDKARCALGMSLFSTLEELRTPSK